MPSASPRRVGERVRGRARRLLVAAPIYRALALSSLFLCMTVVDTGPVCAGYDYAVSHVFAPLDHSLAATRAEDALNFVRGTRREFPWNWAWTAVTWVLYGIATLAVVRAARARLLTTQRPVGWRTVVATGLWLATTVLVAFLPERARLTPLSAMIWIVGWAASSRLTIAVLCPMPPIAPRDRPLRG